MVPGAKRLEPHRQAVEGLPDEGLAGLTRLAQDQALGAPVEQLQPEAVLQGLDLMADRALGDVQFRRRVGEAEVAGGGLEGAQGVQGRQGASHE